MNRLCSWDARYVGEGGTDLTGNHLTKAGSKVRLEMNVCYSSSDSQAECGNFLLKRLVAINTRVYIFSLKSHE